MNYDRLLQEAAREALERMKARKDEDIEEWAWQLAKDLVALGDEDAS